MCKFTFCLLYIVNLQCCISGVQQSDSVLHIYMFFFGLPWWLRICLQCGSPVQSLGWKDPLEKEMATHPNILAWRILCIQEPGGLNPGSPWGHKSWARLSD